MRRRLLALAVAAVLLAVTVVAENRLGAIERADPLGRSLLYLPSREMLQLLSLGNENLIADLLYMWSIQYYSRFRPPDTFLYLETVYGLITDLDPRYFDAYRIGAMIMEIEAEGSIASCKEPVMALFDKGVAAMPEDWALAEVAAWDGYMIFRDMDMAIKYAGIAASRPNSPHRLKRVYGRWRDRTGTWTLQDSLAYWEQAIAEAETEHERSFSRRHMYDVVLKMDRGRLDPMLAAMAAESGACSPSWTPLIEAGWLRSAPLDYAGNEYGIDPETCTLVGHKRIR